MRRKKSSSARETHTHTPSAWGRGQKSPEMRVSASTKIIAFLLHVLVHPACTVRPPPTTRTTGVTASALERRALGVARVDQGMQSSQFPVSPIAQHVSEEGQVDPR